MNPAADADDEDPDATLRISRIATSDGDDPYGAIVLRVIEGPAAGLVVPVGTTGEVIIGRTSPDCALRDAAVSRNHCQVRSVAGRMTIKDLGSTNGTYVNRARVEKVDELVPGDTIEVGDSRVLVVRMAPQGADRATSPPKGVPFHVPPLGDRKDLLIAMLVSLLAITVASLVIVVIVFAKR